MPTVRRPTLSIREKIDKQSKEIKFYREKVSKLEENRNRHQNFSCRNRALTVKIPVLRGSQFEKSCMDHRLSTRRDR